MPIDSEIEKRLQELIGKLRNEVGIDAVYEKGNQIMLKGHYINGVVFPDIEIIRRCNELGFDCTVQSGGGVLLLDLIPLRPDYQSSIKHRIPWMNIILFLATLATTTLAVPLYQGGDFSSRGIFEALQYSIPLMAILLFHESGHYIASKKHKVRVSLPYFIPAPTFLGTFGAIIKSRSPFFNRAQLLDVGAAGPISGFVIAIIAMVIGLSTSGMTIIEPSSSGMTLGDSLIIRFLIFIFIGDIPEGHQLQLNPIAFAGWVGLFVTMLNLIPYGQLDGGHIAYALFGRNYRWVSRGVIIAMLPLGFFWPGWFFWALFLTLLVPFHPPVMDEDLKLDNRRRIFGYISLAIFVLTFTPIPFG